MDKTETWHLGNLEKAWPNVFQVFVANITNKMVLSKSDLYTGNLSQTLEIHWAEIFQDFPNVFCFSLVHLHPSILLLYFFYVV